MNEQKRDALAEAIVAHRYMPCGEFTPTVQAWWAQCEGCDWKGPRRSYRGADDADHRTHIADALLPLVHTWLAEAWDAGYVQAVRDHKMRSDNEAHCDWPTTPNPYGNQETSA